MNKEEILQMSRKENKGRESEWENSIANRASRAGKATGIILCVILVLLDDIILHTKVIGLASWIVFFAMEAASNLILFLSYKKKSMLIWFLIDIFCTIADLTILILLSKKVLWTIS